MVGDGGGWGRCLRLRVSIDLHNPLERGRALSMQQNSARKERLHYENILTVTRGGGNQTMGRLAQGRGAEEEAGRRFRRRILSGGGSEY